MRFNYGLRMTRALALGAVAAVLWLWWIPPADIPARIPFGPPLFYAPAFALLAFAVGQLAIGLGFGPPAGWRHTRSWIYAKPLTRIFAVPLVGVGATLIGASVPAALLVPAWAASFGVDFSGEELLRGSFGQYLSVLIVPAVLATAPPCGVALRERLLEHATYRRWFAFERGGSARWSGPANYRRRRFKAFRRPPHKKDGYAHG